MIKEEVDKEMLYRDDCIEELKTQYRTQGSRISHSQWEEKELERKDRDLDRDYERMKSDIARKIIDQKRHTAQLEGERDSFQKQINAALDDKRVTYGKVQAFWAVAKHGLATMLACCKVAHGDQEKEDARMKVGKHIGWVAKYNNGDWESHKGVIEDIGKSV